MKQSPFDLKATRAAALLVEEFFALGTVGYVALGCGQEVLMRMARGVEGMTETTPESNFFEELLVNPTLLKLASQRGGLDCGGVSYVAIGYGDFTMFITNMKGGHVSLGVARDTSVAELAAKVQAILERHNRLPETPQPWLLASA